MLKVKGKVETVVEEKTLNNGARVGKYVLKEITDNEHPQKFLVDVYSGEDRLQYWGKDMPKQGDIVEVELKVDVREYTPDGGSTKYFGTNRAWRTEILIGNEAVNEPVMGIGEADDNAPF